MKEQGIQGDQGPIIKEQKKEVKDDFTLGAIGGR
jgi:hypothetical protein